MWWNPLILSGEIAFKAERAVFVGDDGSSMCVVVLAVRRCQPEYDLRPGNRIAVRAGQNSTAEDETCTDRRALWCGINRLGDGAAATGRAACPRRWGACSGRGSSNRFDRSWRRRGLSGLLDYPIVRNPRLITCLYKAGQVWWPEANDHREQDPYSDKIQASPIHVVLPGNI